MTDDGNSTILGSLSSENITELLNQNEFNGVLKNMTDIEIKYDGLIDSTFEDTNTTIYVYTALILGCIIFTTIRLYDFFSNFIKYLQST